MSVVGFVINYCSNEQPFMDALLEECSKVSQNIAVIYGDKLYDGVPENTVYLNTYLRRKYPHIKLAEYAVKPEEAARGLGVVRRPTAYWCNLARWMGMLMLPDVDWFFFIDADEVPEGERLSAWLTATALDPLRAYKLANWWYFKDVCNQATTWEDSILLVHRRHLTEETVFHDDERDGILKMCAAPQERMVCGGDGRPMFHHYSWVRGRDGLKRKLRTWAHRDDLFAGAPVEAIVDHIYKDDGVNDIIHRYTYNLVPADPRIIFT